ncbi:hypothetical protein LMBIIBHN_02953 [Aeromonas salmonicida]
MRLKIKPNCSFLVFGFMLEGIRSNDPIDKLQSSRHNFLKQISKFDSNSSSLMSYFLSSLSTSVKSKFFPDVNHMKNECGVISMNQLKA